MFHLKWAEGRVHTWQELRFTGLKICPCCGCYYLTEFLAWLQILDLMFLVQELFRCLLSLLPAVQHLEISLSSVLGLPPTYCSMTQALCCDLRRTGKWLQHCDSLFQRVLAASSEWVLLLVCVGEVKRAWHNAHNFFSHLIPFKPGHHLWITEWRNKWRFLVLLQCIPSGHNSKISVT